MEGFLKCCGAKVRCDSSGQEPQSKDAHVLALRAVMRNVSKRLQEGKFPSGKGPVAEENN